jgi:23S rRNA (cytidine1920-2'-O)/16S rRNA (cytidine1409-2'-O)-methyltransferase
VSETTGRRRADVLLVERGQFESRAKAQEAIAAGLVFADGVKVPKGSTMLPRTARIEAGAAYPFVSRGGVKLDHALTAFGMSVAGRTCLDVGASTGGFTDVLLARGAAHVIAVDTGRAQLHARLRADPRVTALEGTDIRSLDALPSPCDLAVIDVSFISLRLVVPAIAALLRPNAQMIALVKPQFEVGRAHVGKGGIVRDTVAAGAATGDVLTMLTGLGWTVRGPIDSPITGGDGNREYLVGASRGHFGA